MMDQTIYSNMTPDQIISILRDMHRSKGYVVIRDQINRHQLAAITQSEFYQEFQDIKAECKKSFEHDRTTATNADVDRACTAVYGTIIKIFGTQANAVIRELTEIHQAINRIEEAVGISQTKWEMDEGDQSNENGESVTPDN